METIVIKAPKKEIQSIRKFSKQVGSKAEFFDMEEMEDNILIRLIEENIDSPVVDFEEVLKALRE